ncbi:MAG: histidine phosphatase family protein [Anaerolineales bacterium]|nr:histidine phosphatase family protein [Anaerolineales bacterium]MDW8160782.1 histidine phosphatase family protein [Anaerolineales bacterium]
MPFLLLIRHAENDYTRKGRLAGRLPRIHLNRQGREQAEMLAKLLERVPLKAVYSSPLERALETAEPLAKMHHLEVVREEGLIELDYGEWQGKSLRGLRRLKSWRTVQSSPSLTQFPQGERISEAQHRVVQALYRIAEKHADEDWIACISHADPIKLAVAYFLGIPLDLYQRISISLASITALYLGRESVRLVAVNYASGLFEGLEKK